MNRDFVELYDEFVGEVLTIDILDIEEICLIDNKIIVFNVDGLSYQTTNIKFNMKG